MSICERSRHQKPVVQTLAAMHDDVPPPQPERYQLLGADCPTRQYVCGDFGPPIIGDGAYLDEAIDGSIPEPSEQVFPLHEAPSGTDLPNVGELRSIEALEDECRFNAGKIGKVRLLAGSYSHWRPVRGDGNCYYRAVAYGAIEALLAEGGGPRLGRVVGAFERLWYQAPAEQRGHERLLRQLRSWSSAAQLERWVSQDSAVDQALVRACRRLVRHFLIEHADEAAPNGMTYSELVHALDATYADVEDFCARVVDPMGRDAETLALDALPMQLGVGLRLWILDRREEVDLVSLDTPGPDGKVSVHVLFKPGHYDLLYPREMRSQGLARTCCQADGNESDVLAEPGQQSLPCRATPPLSSRGPREACPTTWHGANHSAQAASAYQHGRVPRNTLVLPSAFPPARILPCQLALAPLAHSPNQPSALPSPLTLVRPSAIQPGLAPPSPVAPSPVLPRALTPGVSHTLPGPQPTSLCSTPLRKARDGEKAHLRGIPGCGMFACTQAVDGTTCDCHRMCTNCTGDARVGLKTDSGVKCSGGLGCTNGILFSLSGFLQCAVAGRHRS